MKLGRVGLPSQKPSRRNRLSSVASVGTAARRSTIPRCQGRDERETRVARELGKLRAEVRASGEEIFKVKAEADRRLQNQAAWLEDHIGVAGGSLARRVSSTSMFLSKVSGRNVGSRICEDTHDRISEA